MEVAFADRESWRAWLDANGRRVREVWLVFHKKHTGKPCLTYEAAVEEALCVGWIDSLIKRLDDDRYARKFTPRTDAGKWSAANIARVQRLVAAGRMTEAGLARYAPTAPPGAEASPALTTLPDYFEAALAKDGRAREFFEQLAPSHRRKFIGWVASAKREETRQKRLKEALGLLREGRKLDMK